MLLGIALLVLLIVWALNSVGGGGGDGTEPAGDDNAGGPAESITPGPTPSESFIDERPGGREEPEPQPEPSGDEDGTGGDAGGDAGDVGGGTGGDAGGSASGGGTGGGTGGGAGDAEGLPTCVPGDVSLSLSSAENEYGLDELPELVLTVENVSGVSCAVDFGYSALTVTITDAGAEQVWSSADCPDGSASLPTAVWAGDSATHTIEWDRYHSTGDCDPARGAAAAAGTSYLAEATLSGFSDVPQAPFRLDND